MSMSRQFFITVPAATVGVRPYTIDPESADRSEALTRLKSNYCGSCLASEHLLGTSNPTEIPGSRRLSRMDPREGQRNAAYFQPGGLCVYSTLGLSIMVPRAIYLADKFIIP